MSDDKSRALRDYWLQFHRQKKFTLPEFSNILMPIASVLAIVGLNYRRRL